MAATAATTSSLSIGDIEITYLPDGIHHVQGPSHYPNVPAELFDRYPQVHDADGWLVMSIGAVLVRTPGNTVLVDTGAGDVDLSMTELTGGAFHGDLVGGALLASLASVGVAAEDVDTVVFTHLHNDHVGWVSRPDGLPTFPAARNVVEEKEWEFWSAPEHAGSIATCTPAQFEVLRQRLDLFDGGAGAGVEIVPGIATFPTPGHTPGHTCYRISSGHESALVLGDVFHCPVELMNPGMAFVFDLDAAQAERSRKVTEAALLEPDTWFVAGHFPDDVFGRVQAGPDGLRLLPGRS